MLIARPNAMILYATLAKGPKLPLDLQVNSTRQFMRELNRLGITSAIDAGGGFQNYPEDYPVIEELDRNKQLTIRIAYNLFTQNKGQELEDFQRWTEDGDAGPGQRLLPPQRRRRDAGVLGGRLRGLPGAAPGPGAGMEDELEKVVRHLVASAGRSACTRPTTNRSRACSTCSRRSTARSPSTACTGCSTTRDHQRAQYRARARAGRRHRDPAPHGLPGRVLRRALRRRGRARHAAGQAHAGAGVPVGAGTDATRVASYNPWTALYWLVTGRTVGGLRAVRRQWPAGPQHALELWTAGSAWFSNEQGRKGRIQAGMLADLAVLSTTSSACRRSDQGDRIGADGGRRQARVRRRRIHGLGPPPIPVLPEWSPVPRCRATGAAPAAAQRSRKPAAPVPRPCGVHAHAHDKARKSTCRCRTSAASGARSAAAASRSEDDEPQQTQRPAPAGRRHGLSWPATSSTPSASAALFGLFTAHVTGNFVLI
jgi:hypothetical protein